MSYLTILGTFLKLIFALLTYAQESRLRGEGQLEALQKVMEDARKTVQTARVQRSRSVDELRAHDQFERDS